jgi:hypothetical protein
LVRYCLDEEHAVIFEEGDTVRITGDGLLRLSKEAPRDFQHLQTLETRRGRLLHVAPGAEEATVEVAPDLAIRVPFASIVNETPHEDVDAPPRSASVRIQGDEEYPGVGAAYAGPVQEATREAMDRFEENGQRSHQANTALSVLSIFAAARHRLTDTTAADPLESWKGGGNELDTDESRLYKAAISRLEAYVTADVEVPTRAGTSDDVGIE